MQIKLTTHRRQYVPIVREAIDQFIAEGRRENYYEIDGYTVLVDQAPGVLDEHGFGGRDDVYHVGLYEPGSVAEGRCDHYAICSADGEQAESDDEPTADSQESVNAELLSIARDLLRAVESTGVGYSHVSADLRQRARAIIAKAEGR